MWPHWLNGLGSPFGFEIQAISIRRACLLYWLNGLGSPFGFEIVVLGRNRHKEALG